MPTKNLVPRQDGEGKIGVKGVDLTLKWKEINAISGSLDTINLDEINNLSGQPLLVPGSGITINHAEDPQNGYQYTISSSSSGFSDKIEEGQAKVEVVDTTGNDDATIQFWADPNNNGVSSKIWEFDKDGHLIPDVNEEYDIGKAEKKVRHLFLSNNSLHIGTSPTSDPNNWNSGGPDIYKLGKNDSHQLVWNTDGAENIIATLSSGQSLHPIATSGDYSDLVNKPIIPSSSDDLTSDHNATNYTGNLNANLTAHLSGIDTALGTLISDKVTQADIDAAIQGLDIKPSVRVATTQALSATFSYVNANTQQWQEINATGALTIDDVVLTNGDRVLVKDASAQTQNGIYVVSGIDGTSQVILDRSSDLDNSSDFGGAFTFVEEGTTNSGNSYVAKNASSPNSTTVGTNTQNWTQFNSAGSVTALNDLSDVSYSTGTLTINGLNTLNLPNSGSISGGVLDLKNAGVESSIRLYCQTSNIHFTELKSAPHGDYSGNVTFTLPGTAGTPGQVLSTNGSGILSWVAQSSGGIASVEEDSSPVLGGNLNVRNDNDSTNYKITASLGDLVLGVDNSNQETIIKANTIEALRVVNGQYSDAVNGNQIQAIGNMSLNPISSASTSVTSLRLKGEDEASIVLGTTDGVKISRDANDVNRPNTVQISNAAESTDDNSPDLEIYSNSTTASNSSRIRFTRAAVNSTSLGELSSFILNTEYNRVNFDRVNTDGIIKLGVLSNSVIREGIKIQGSSGAAQVRISNAFNLPTFDGSPGQVLSTNGSGQTAWTPVPSPFTTLTSNLSTVTLTSANVILNLTHSSTSTSFVRVNLPVGASDGDMVILTRPSASDGAGDGNFPYVSVYYNNTKLRDIQIMPSKGSFILTFNGSSWTVPISQDTIKASNITTENIYKFTFGREIIYANSSAGNTFTLALNHTASDLIEGMHQRVVIRGTRTVTITSNDVDIIDPSGGGTNGLTTNSVTLDSQNGIIDIYVFADSSTSNKFLINASPASSSSSSGRPIFETIASNSATITSPTSADELERIVLFKPTTAITVTLPDINSSNEIKSQDGFKYQLKNTSAHNVTVNRGGTNVIDGTLTQLTLNPNDSYTIVAVGNNDWYII